MASKADPAATVDDTLDTTGQDTITGVEADDSAEFGDIFNEFAAAGNAAPGEEEDGDGDGAEDGQDGEEGAPGDQPAADPAKTAPAAKAPADQAAAGKNPDEDPWKDATPAQIAARDQMNAALAKAQEIASRASGRASGLQRQINAMTGNGKAAGEPAAETAEKGEAQKALEAKVAQIQEDYPEFKPLIELLQGQIAGLDALRGQVTPVIEADQAEVIHNAQASLTAKHPDWTSYPTDDTPETRAWLAKQPAKVKEDNAAFRGWLGSQSEPIQALASSWDANDVAAVLTLFKTERAESIRSTGAAPAPKNDTATDARRKRQLDGGKEAGGKSAVLTSEADSDDFGAHFTHFQRLDERRKNAAK